ncbi:hypothetical protein BDN72DRAFT_141986 [Pluteus cervinus]|uniref:Uncharacterized protein n=1 Tax=Pluteus cervinus TaxID=181527 RepID=A0ACD3AKZ6_9AGAR|nr:hypothetical protein BDN72DRAFT_141986 [Pluteus cervinus]
MLVIFLLLSLLRVKALPISSSFSPNAPPSIPHTLIFGRSSSCGFNSDGRTLIDIVISCTLTIAICVYHAIHPNIPDPEASFWKVQLDKLKVTIHALIAPEVMIFWAMRQWVGARLIAKDVNQAFKDRNLDIMWTATHGHFVQMGGFCREDTRHVISTSMLVELIKENRINLKGLRLTREDINDRSKGDVLSKGFLILQTTWFILECITRRMTGLPLTELEVVTLAYAALNIVTCAFWFDKPLNVTRPNYLEIYTCRSVQTGLDDIGANTLEEKCATSPTTDNSVGDEDHPLALDDINIRSWRDIASGLSWGMEKPLISTITTRTRKLLHLGKIAEVPPSVRVEPYRRILFGLFIYLLKRPFCYIVAPFFDLMNDSTVDSQARYVPCYYSLKIPTEMWWIMWYPSCTIAFIFGAVHFLAWNSHFPTPVEQTLWRISTVATITVPFEWLVLGVVFDVHDRWKQPRLGRRTRVALQVLCFVWATFSFFAPLTYVIARICLMVQSLVSLRALPAEAYVDVAWTSLVPHFSS